MEERLQKILAHAGIASRRQSEQLIREGRVRVNGHLVREMGVKADPGADTITVDGRKIRKLRKFTYILLNKPRRVMSTVSDPEGRRTVIDLVGEGRDLRLYPVGRLDFGSEGLMILTNDGEFTRIMTRPGGAAKVYGIKVNGVPSPKTLDKLRRGLRIEGRSYAPCEIRPVSEDTHSWYEVTLHEGQNRQLRRMFEAVGHPVMRLRRTQLGFLTAPTLRPGAWRHLTSREVQEFYRMYGARRSPADQAGGERRKAGRAGRRASASGPRR
jgi:23S rRNA pseudouridine2605 synthase